MLLGINPNFRFTVWAILSGLLATLTLFLTMRGKNKLVGLGRNLKTLLRLTLIMVPFVGVIVVASYFLLLPKHSGDKTVNILPEKLFGWKFPQTQFPASGSVDNSTAYSGIRDPGGIPQGLPVRLKIPVIGVDSTIEDAEITNDGRMDVPAGSVNVAWFSLGPHPGQKGSAVIGGHFGIDGNVPKVFYNLDKLKIGDKIYIVDDKDETHAFIVRSTMSFDRNADATTVFTSNDNLSHLNLITCEGVWNQINDSYPNRLVIFTDAIPSEGAVVVDKAKTTIPNPSTRIEPTAISVQSGMKNSPFPTQILIASTKSLYETSVDGLITSFLIVSIIFITIKIIRR